MSGVEAVIWGALALAIAHSCQIAPRSAHHLHYLVIVSIPQAPHVLKHFWICLLTASSAIGMSQAALNWEMVNAVRGKYYRLSLRV